MSRNPRRSRFEHKINKDRVALLSPEDVTRILNDQAIGRDSLHGEVPVEGGNPQKGLQA